MQTHEEKTMLSSPFKVGALGALEPPNAGPGGGPGGFLHLKCRQPYAFEVTLEDMSGSFSKISDSAVEEQCQQLLQEGECRQALELLMEAYGPSIYSFCCNMLHDTNTAADILQTTFVQAFNNLPGFEKRLSFYMWLLTIARNRAVDHLRTIRRRERVSVQIDDSTDVADVTPLADQLIHKQQMLRALEQCLDELRLKTKDDSILNTLMLRFRENLPYEQISKMLGSTTVALRVRVTRILPKLKQCIESKGGRAS